jgi:tryptophan halogenase
VQTKPSILIVGGGTAGWMAAAYLASTQKYQVTLIESAVIPTIGVGESTVPSIATFFDSIGISEQDLFDHCSAVRKYSIEHHNWTGRGESFWHHFCQDESQHEEQLYWMENYIRPDKKWRWAYHLDATKLAPLIRDKSALPMGVKHIIDDVVDVSADHDGIQAVHCQNGTYTADFYIDCTGFRALLRNKLGSVYKKHESLINDTAICGPGHYAPGESPLRYTQTFAMDYGWRWRVCLQHRTGNGYAFNSTMLSIEDARKEFMAKARNLDCDKLFVVPIRNGYNPEPWKANVVSLGLSCGFLEPLEALGIFLVHGPVVILDRWFHEPDGARKYNRAWNNVYHQISDFLSTIYRTSHLEHTEYWRKFDKIHTVRLPQTQQSLFDKYSYRNLARSRGLEYQ